MHNYLRAIGFSRLKNKIEQNQIITTAFENSTDKRELEVGSDAKLVQANYQIFNGIGISIIGAYDKDNSFIIDHSFPYCLGQHAAMQPDIQIERYSDKEAYSCISEDYNLGVTLIYFLVNVVDYVRSTWLNDFYKIPKKVKFGALSLSGRILYGVLLEHNPFPYDKQPISNKARRNLIAKARSGDMDALENLTLDDMDTYSLISKRIKDEDLLTVIETYMIPYGIDNEQYSVLGIIQSFEQITNEFSKELVYNLTVVCNDIPLNIVINSLDLQGEPKVGRRFKGIIWLQGQIDFK